MIGAKVVGLILSRPDHEETLDEMVRGHSYCLNAADG